MGGFGERLLLRARSIVGLGLVGCVLGLLGGGLWGLATTLLEVGLFFDPEYWSFLLRSVVSSATYFALPAAFATTSFGVLLAAVEGRRSLLDLPLWRMAAFGALGGGLFFPVWLLARGGLGVAVHFIGSAFPIGALHLMASFAALGGILTVSLTAVAKRAHRAELNAVRHLELPSRSE